MAQPPFDAVLNPACPVHGAEASAILVEAIDRGVLIQEHPLGRCQLCGAVAETRPYGPNGEDVCFDCGPGSKDPAARAAAERAFARRMSA